MTCTTPPLSTMSIFDLDRASSHAIGSYMESASTHQHLVTTGAAPAAIAEAKRHMQEHSYTLQTLAAERTKRMIRPPLRHPRPAPRSFR